VLLTGLPDASEQPIDANRDGQPGGNFVVTFGAAGIRLASFQRAGWAISLRALDALLVEEADPTAAEFAPVWTAGYPVLRLSREQAVLRQRQAGA
jgi:hypothetical protein